MIISYASRTGTLVNLDGLRKRGWRLLISATGRHRTEGFEENGIGIDNGAWTFHQAGLEFIGNSFETVLDLFGDIADFSILPDIVAGGERSLELSLKWMKRVTDSCKLALLPVQDGMDEAMVRPHLAPNVGIFVGGGTEFKLSTVGRWAKLARELGVWCHVGRVNSQERIRLCQAAGATSFDGTCASRYLVKQPSLQRAIAQPMIELDMPHTPTPPPTHTTAPIRTTRARRHLSPDQPLHGARQ